MLLYPNRSTGLPECANSVCVSTELNKKIVVVSSMHLPNWSLDAEVSCLLKTLVGHAVSTNGALVCLARCLARCDSR